MKIRTVTTLRSLPISCQWLKKAAEHFAKNLNLPPSKEVALVCVGERKMKTLNGVFSGDFKVTNVLSFSSKETYANEKWPAQSVENKNDLGEIILCVPQIVKEAKFGGGSIKEEFATIVAHGLLHLIGKDHKKKSHAQQMYTKQDKLVYNFLKSKKH